MCCMLPYWWNMKLPHRYPNPHPKRVVPISCMTTAQVAVPATVNEWHPYCINGHISCLFPFQDVAVLEQYWHPFPSPLVAALLAVHDDRVVIDVPPSCSVDFKRSAKNRVDAHYYVLTYQSNILTVLFFVLLFSFLLSTLQSNDRFEHLSVFALV